MEPISEHDGIPQFSSDQVKLYGSPDKHGYKKFFVIQAPPDLVADYDMEKQYDFSKRPIHFYSGIDRFKLVLGHLIGATFGVSKKTLSEEPWATIIYEITKLPANYLWDGTRRLLKKYKLKIYLNRIPSIVTYAGWRYCTTKLSTGVFKTILEEFEKLYRVFYRIRKGLNRKYFLNMRFVAIKLMQRHNIQIPLNIPCLRSPVKLKELNILYDKLWTIVIKEEEEDLLNFFA